MKTYQIFGNRTVPARKTIECLAGHPHHDTRLIDIRLAGASLVPDYPSVPARLATSLTLMVYDAIQYMGFPNYCTGQDEISKSISEQRTWEGYETLVVSDILSRGDRHRLVLDFGSHIGWYSLLAARFGYQVIAFDADAENLRVLQENAKLNGFQDQIETVHCWVDDQFPDLVLDSEIELLKCDIEANENHMLRACRTLFARRLVKHSMIEISPVFKKGLYEQVSDDIVACGYDVFDIPGKGFRYKQDFEVDPLGTVRQHCGVDPSGLDAYIKSLDQSNFLFAAR